jgi:hypothetical protein
MTSMQINAVQRGGFGVDKNLYGVSRQVTAPGVLVFGHIFGELSAGKECPEKRSHRLFARTAGLTGFW